MSHVTAIQAKVQDVQDAMVGAEACDMEVVKQPKFKWYGRWMNDWHTGEAAVTQGYDPKTFGQCEYVIRRKDRDPRAYEIGMVPRKDGDGYDLVYDTYSTGGHLVEEKAGSRLAKLKTEIGVAYSMRKLKAAGHTPIRTKDKHGRTKVVARR